MDGRRTVLLHYCSAVQRRWVAVDAASSGPAIAELLAKPFATTQDSSGDGVARGRRQHAARRYQGRPIPGQVRRAPAYSSSSSREPLSACERRYAAYFPTSAEIR
jgi:hypothetical protein